MAVSFRAEVDARDMARVARVLNRVDKSLIDELRSSMKSGIMPIGQLIAARVNAGGIPLSGMSHRGPTRWLPVKVSAQKVSVTPGVSRKNTNLVTLNFYNKQARGLAIAENAGSRSAGESPQGKAFIRNLNAVVSDWPNGGRFLYRAYMPFKPHVEKLGENILKRWIAKTNKEIEGM
jgi:hypothetical protein